MNENGVRDLNLSSDEIRKLGNAFADDTFKELFGQYLREISDPENQKLLRREIVQFEKERGHDVEIVEPSPGYSLKTSANGSSKAYVNICSSENIGRIACAPVANDGATGVRVLIPHSVSPVQKIYGKRNCAVRVYTVVYHPETLERAAKNSEIRRAVEETAFSAIEKSFNVVLDKINSTVSKKSFKGTVQLTKIRKRDACATACSDSADSAAVSFDSATICCDSATVRYDSVDSTMVHSDSATIRFDSVDSASLTTAPADSASSATAPTDSASSAIVSADSASSPADSASSATASADSTSSATASAISASSATAPVDSASSATALADSATATVQPSYRIKYRNEVDLQDSRMDRYCKMNALIPSQMIIEIDLPLLKSIKDLNLDVQSTRVTLQNEKPSYSLNLSLPYEVDATGGTAKFDTDSRILKLELAVKRKISLTNGHSNSNNLVTELDDREISGNQNGSPRATNQERAQGGSSDDSFLNPDLSYKLPAHFANYFQNRFAFTMNVRNVRSNSFKFRILEQGTAFWVKFSNIGGGHFPMHFAAYVQFPQKVTNCIRSLEYVVNEENVFVYVLLTDGFVPLEYFVGTDTDTLMREYLDEPEAVHLEIENNVSFQNFENFAQAT